LSSKPGFASFQNCKITKTVVSSSFLSFRFDLLIFPFYCRVLQAVLTYY
jgi:hypothetical protein